MMVHLKEKSTDPAVDLSGVRREEQRFRSAPVSREGKMIVREYECGSRN